MRCGLIGASLSLLLLVCSNAHAWLITIAPSSRMDYLYLQVGAGGGPGSPSANNPNLSTVSVSLTPAQVLNPSAAVPMNVDVTGASNFVTTHTCGRNELFIGAYWNPRGNSPNQAISLTVSFSTSFLVDRANGNKIPFSEIISTTKSPGATGENLPATRLSPGSISGFPVLVRFQSNKGIESCLAFLYGNSTPVLAGTYEGTVTYTLTVP